jgi:preprotein translocase subunit SecD
MRAIKWASVLAVLAFGLVLPARAEKPDEKPKVKFEIRRAEAKPTDGLVKATVAGSAVYLYPTAELTNEDIADARIVEQPEARVAIDFIFTEAGTKKMEKLSEKQIDKPLAILIDGKVIAAPTVKAKISGRAQITGSFTREEAAKIVRGVIGK